MLGRSLGNYGVVSKIGEGGMGVVYLAKHVTLGRRAAIKVLRPDLSSNQDIISRFFNEARAATAVRNPGIVEVYDFGFLEDRTAYIIMEYLDGESLASRIRRGRAPIGATLTIVRAIARILQSAHEQGIVHRDLKPDNVFLVPDAELASGERVKLLDFGIAKLAHGLGNASHTTTGTVMGTPTYMAPEQCRGAGAVDHRADLYSLGCLAYEMLCGQPPFVADGPGDVIARHLYFEPAPLRSHRSEIPPELDDLVLWLLQKEPLARPVTAADLIRAVDHLAAVTPPVMPRTEPPVVAGVTVPRSTTETTLGGAASMRMVPTTNANSHGIWIITGVAAATIALVVVIVLARGGSDRGETGSAGDPKPHDAAAHSAEPAASTAAIAASSTAPPLVPATAFSVEVTQAPLVADHPAAPTGDTVAATAPVKLTTARPTDAARSSETANSLDGAKPAQSKSSDVAKSSAVVWKDDTARSPEAAGASAAAKPADAACARTAFAAALDADAPSETAVQAALARLRRCKATMKAEQYADIQRQLVAKL
jgi:serine/threonine protein kinase